MKKLASLLTINGLVPTYDFIHITLPQIKLIHKQIGMLQQLAIQNVMSGRVFGTLSSNQQQLVLGGILKDIQVGNFFARFFLKKFSQIWRQLHPIWAF